LGLLATITLEVITFRAYAPFTALLPFFKCIVKVVFCEVFSTARDSAAITSVVSNSVLSSIGETEKSLRAKSDE
jgi:threonine/homoserine efflux transporter RhtA